MCSDQMSPSSLGSLSSAELWDNSSGGLAESRQNDGPVAGLFQAGFSSMVQQLSESHNHVAQLECELKALTEEKLKQEYQNHVCVSRLKEQIRILEQKAELDLEELKRRQNQLRCKLVQLEELLLVKEKEKTEATKAFENILKEKAECEKALNDKEHCIEVLQLEKAYSNGQYRTFEEQLHKLEADKIFQQERIRDLEEAQKCFYNRVVSSEDTAETSRQQLLHVEKVQLQERNKQELDLLRTQIAEAADFEIQMLRRTRDLAVSECDKAQAALQESRTQKEQLIERINELKLENVKSRPEGGGVSQREAELQRVQEGTYHELCEAKIENKVLAEKLESSTQNLLKLECEFTKVVLDLKLKLESASASLQNYQTGEQLLNEALLNTCKVLSDANYEATIGERGVVRSMQGKLDIISTFSKRYKMLQENFKSVESERESLKLQILGAEEKPRSCLVNSIQQKEKELKEVLQTKEALETKLREAVLNKNKANRSLQNFREDLRRVLEARGNMESLKRILMEKDPNLGTALSAKLATLKNHPRTL